VTVPVMAAPIATGSAIQAGQTILLLDSLKMIFIFFFKN
jgi:biotin carboxyl carrier protein